MKLTRTFTLLIVPIVLTACQSNSVNKLIRDLPSPDGRFHVESPTVPSQRCHVWWCNTSSGFSSKKR